MKLNDAIIALRTGREGGHIVAGKTPRSFVVVPGYGTARGTITHAQLTALAVDYLLEPQTPPGFASAVWKLPAPVLEYLTKLDRIRTDCHTYPLNRTAIWIHKGSERDNKRLRCKITGRITDGNGRLLKVIVELDGSDEPKSIDPIRCVPCATCPLCDGKPPADGCRVCLGQGEIPWNMLPLPGEISAKLMTTEGATS